MGIWTPEEARTALTKWAEACEVPHADRIAIRRDTDRGRTWGVVVLGDKGGHFTLGPEFDTWPKCEAYCRGLIDGWRTDVVMRRLVREGHVTGAPHPYAS